MNLFYSPRLIKLNTEKHGPNSITKHYRFPQTLKFDGQKTLSFACLLVNSPPFVLVLLLHTLGRASQARTPMLMWKSFPHEKQTRAVGMYLFYLPTLLGVSTCFLITFMASSPIHHLIAQLRR